ncbi:hypothetical protein Verru16b_01606 [Lacunisphaera limnophila]|uniref:Glycosyltransferase RgtA/B/C/D-like domain-containing protein n=1 Tax=Lacunisphaera limnophila TaxID=1838286 RepID=A0A1D8AUH4_9BACT|nr:hypothetical protein [Lacunisphaera limnophila]AOS44543.1 hypothetical protein Verru16b_01606 [Lacunisphaera limnophila]
MSRPGWWRLLWPALGAVLLVAAYLLLNTTFMLYDDEGYVLITYQQFIAGGRLYTEIFSQYGPWPYLYHWLAGTIGASTLSHDFGRGLTALHWVGCALAGGLIAGRLCGSRLAALATGLITFGLLWQMSAEPSHPGGLISVMLALATLVAVTSLHQARWHVLGAVLGLTGALLLLTKINIGLLFLAGAGGGLLFLTAWPAPIRRLARLAATAGLLAVPWGLMGSRLGEPWVLTFAVHMTLALAGVLWLQRPSALGLLPVRLWFATITAFLLTVAAVTAVMALRGTPPAALFHAVVLAPLQHPASFLVGLTWPAAGWLAAALGGGLVFRAGLELRSQGRVSELTRRLALAGRLLAVACFVWHAGQWSTLTGVSRFLMWSLPLLPVFLIPLRRDAPASANASAALFLATTLALPQVLHAFPVAGSQMGWGSFLLLPLFAWGLNDSWPVLAGYAPRRLARLPVSAWVLLLAVGLGQLGLLLQTGWQRYHDAKPIDLPGAEDIRPGDNARLTLRLMTLNAAIHADVLFSYPGMYSYNLWSGVATPTAQNATHWFWLLDDAAQQRIIDRLQATPRNAIISNDGFDDYLLKQRVPSRGPLRPQLDKAYRPLLRYGHFQFLVPKDSDAAPFGLAEMLVADDPTAPVEFSTLLRTNLALQGRPASFQLQEVIAPWLVQATYTPTTSRIFLEPIDRQGRSLGPLIGLPLTHDLAGLYRVHLYCSTRPDLSHPYSLVLVGLDQAGTVLSESVF